MNVLKYSQSSPENIGKHKMYRKMPQHETLDNFIGKFHAKTKINSVDLKHNFKNGVL